MSKKGEVSSDVSVERRRKGSELHQLRVYLVHHERANSIARVGHQAILMSYKQAFNASVEFQIRDLGLSEWVVNRGRRVLEESGLLLYDAKAGGYVRTSTPGKTINRRFNESIFNLGYRSQTLRIDMAAMAADDKAHGSYPELAKRLLSNPSAVEAAIRRTDARVPIFDTEIFTDGRFAFRPRVELVADLVSVKPVKTWHHVLTEEFGITHPRLLKSLVEIITSARKLRLTEDMPHLVRELVKLYKAMEAERNNADLPRELKLRLGGPLGY